MKTLLIIWIVVVILMAGAYTYITNATSPQTTQVMQRSAKLTDIQPAANPQTTAKTQQTINGKYMQGVYAQELSL